MRCDLNVSSTIPSKTSGDFPPHGDSIGDEQLPQEIESNSPKTASAKSVPLTGSMPTVGHGNGAEPQEQFYGKNISNASGDGEIHVPESAIASDNAKQLSARNSTSSSAGGGGMSDARSEAARPSAADEQKQSHIPTAVVAENPPPESIAKNPPAAERKNTTEERKQPAKVDIPDNTSSLVAIKNPKLSVEAPVNGANFYFEQQRNGSVCGLCALRNYAGAPWISIKTLNDIKSGHFSGRAAVSTACDHIKAAIKEFRRQLGNVAGKNTSPSGDRCDGAVKLLLDMERLAAEPNPNGREIVNTIDALLRKLAEVGLSRLCECEDLRRQKNLIVSDCLDVSSGGADPEFVLEALRMADKNALFAIDEKPLNYASVFKLLDGKKASRAIVCASGHFIALRKDAAGRWFVLDSLNSGPVAISGAGGPHAGRRYHGIIYSTNDSIKSARIGDLSAAMGGSCR
jgi:hypothetical protein